MSVDEAIPTEHQLQEFIDNGFLYLSDVKNALEKKMNTTYEYIFSGSAVERYGVPFMMSYKATGCVSAMRARCSIDPLHTDVDLMFWSLEDQASFSGQGNILIEPLVTQGRGFIGYAQLTYVTPGVERACVSSKLIKKQALDAVRSTPVVNLPGIPCCCGMTELTPKIQLSTKGPSTKLRFAPLFEADITLCIHCPQWPPMSDWSSRPRYWPSVDEAQRIMSLGCHLVAKSEPSDKEETSWRFSFSLAEVELSKLVPDTARKCFLALKIILKDHLQPVVPMINSYHIKTIFLNTLEKVPVGFWVDSNIEECFLTLLAELRDALLSMNCRHHWFSSINMFDMFAKNPFCYCIETKSFQRLAKKVQTILNDPAPFIFDDGCCCLSPCCLRAPHYNFTSRTKEQFLADYEEVMLSADGHVIPRAQHRVGSQGNIRCQPYVHSSLRCKTQLDPSFYSLSGSHSHEITVEPAQVVAPFPPTHEQGPSICPDEAEQGSGFCPDKDDGNAITKTQDPANLGNHRYQLPVSPSLRCEAQLDQSLSSSGGHIQEVVTEPGQVVACVTPVHDAEQDLGFCPGEAEDNSFGDSLPILVSSPFEGWLARLLQYFKVA